MADTPTPAPAAAPPASLPDEAAKRQKARFEQLLGTAAVRSTGQVALASGSTLDYAVTAEFLPVVLGGSEPDAQEPKAAVMTTAYTVAGHASRPVCFAFNGGPGSASIWLHLGALGPKRVVVPDDGSMPPAPYGVQDNPHTWLEHFDLVFIDPPHTGWSLNADEAARKKLLGTDGDIACFSEVIRLWLTRHRRFGSPVYLCGESYGTTRGAGIANQLHELGVVVNGAILVSLAMDLQSIVFAPGNDLPYALFLPAFANVSQYHGLLQGPQAVSPEAARAAAEAFVQEDYAAALLAGARLTEKTRSRLARRMAELTGLSRTLVEEKNLRISDHTYFFEALRHRGLIVGRLEARSTGPMAASRTRDWEFDPGIEAIAAPYAMAAMRYFSEALGLSFEQRYMVINGDVNRGWNWIRGGESEARRMGYTCTSTDLAQALRRNPHFKVLAASGRYDLGTPYSASDWSLAQLDAPAEVLQRVTHRYYDAGHMMYTRQADLVQLKADVAAWVAS
ncbi:MAG: peptidase S10 [Rubrivivax sp.]|nr:peptidase S10 [Rubrivivax sp.]